MLDLLHLGLPLVVGYAETHYRFFRLQPSLLYRSQPEAVFDMPRRLAPGYDLPVSLILNDVERFPCEVEDIALAVTAAGRPPRLVALGSGRQHIVAHALERRARVFLFSVPRGDLPGEGPFYVTGKALLRVGRRQRVVVNDNLPGSSQLSMACRVCTEDLPAQECCAYADLHAHTQYSESHVEFGLPVSVTAALASAYGLDALGITDHSYDLAASLQDYLKPTQQPERWQRLTSDIGSTEVPSVMLMQGEEISCLNTRGKVVHLCGLGMRDFVPGSLDGARAGRRRERQFSLAGAASEVHRQGGYCFAAHPGATAGLLQSLLLSRGNWSASDVDAGIDGFQAVNGNFDRQWQRGRALWVRALQRGRRLPLLAGNDAHGDFNRYRCVRTPFLSIHENAERHLGYTRTGVYGRPADAAALIAALRSGRTFATSGPCVAVSCTERIEDCVVGQVLSRGAAGLRVLARSSREFGPVQRVIVYGGAAGERAERVLLSVQPPADALSCGLALPPGCTDSLSYLRAECCSRGRDGVLYPAASSAVYFSA